MTIQNLGYHARSRYAVGCALCLAGQIDRLAQPVDSPHRPMFSQGIPGEKAIASHPAATARPSGKSTSGMLFGGVKRADIMHDHSPQTGIGMIGAGSLCPTPSFSNNARFSLQKTGVTTTAESVMGDRLGDVVELVAA